VLAAAARAGAAAGQPAPAPRSGGGDRGAAHKLALPPKATRAQAGTAAPAAEFADERGAKQTLAAYRGRPVLVNLWATWCVPCIAELPTLDRLQARTGKRLKVLAISQDLGGWRDIRRFAKPGLFPALDFRSDKDTNFAVALKAAGLPMTVLYDANGRELWRVNGSVEWDKLPDSAFGL